MKKLNFAFIFALCCLSLMQGCKEKYITYDDAEYIMFSQDEQLYIVREDMLSYDLAVASTVARPYDRTFAVEVLESESTAVEKRDYVIPSYNFTIPAGERVGYVRINALFDNLDTENRKEIAFRLVVNESLVTDLYGDKTVVAMQKTNKFKRENFTGWAVVSSMFLYEFSLDGSYQRLVYTEADPDSENGVIVHDFLADGYDVKLYFDDDTDPASPRVYSPSGQIISNEAYVFGTIHGDNHILMEDSTYAQSYFLGHANIAVLYNRVYVEKIGTVVGTVDTYVTELDWVSDEEAERLKREDGM